MRILLIHQFFLEDDEGGGGRWNEMGRIWTMDGHDVTVLAGTVHYMNSSDSPAVKTSFFRRKVNRYGVRVIRCHVSNSYNRNFLGRLWGYFSFSFSAMLGGIFYAREKYDLIIVSSPPLFVGLTALVLSTWKRIPYLFEIRDLWPESAIDTGVVTNRLTIKMAYWLESLLYKRAKLINVLTPAFKEVLLKKGVPGQKIICIPNAADFMLAGQISDQLDVEAFRAANGLTGKLVIVYVGAHGRANHLTQILDAADLLRNTPAFFLMIGDGMEKRVLKAEATRRKLENVRFLDPVSKEEVFKFILAADVGTSVLKNTETFKTVYSNKTFDYFSCKKPVLMGIDGISRQLVADADAGLFVQPENAADFAAKVRFYLDNPMKISMHGENGFRYALEHFDRRKLAIKYIVEIRKHLT